MSLIISIIALGLIVAIHEFGHFSMARLFRVGVVEFTIGMGPKVVSTVKGNTRYSIRALPFGGACMMLGEENEENEEAGRTSGDLTNAAFDSSAPRVIGDEIHIDGRVFRKSEQLVNKPAWQRFLIFLGGPLFNFILAFLLALIITSYYGYDPSVITEVTAGMPVAEAGIEADDRITGLASLPDDAEKARFTSIETARDIQLFMMIHADEMQARRRFAMQYCDASDANAQKEAVLIPMMDEELGRSRLGFGYSLGYIPAASLGEIVHYSLYDVKYCIRSAVLSVKMLLQGSVRSTEVMGPVRMVAVMDETVDTAAEHGTVEAVMTLINMMILISGSLGAMNLLPLPALDGGRIVFVLIEMVTRHAVPKELEGKIHLAGMLLLLVLMVLILFNDIIMLLLA